MVNALIVSDEEDHIHPYGQPVPDRVIGDTRIVNVVGRRTMEL